MPNTTRTTEGSPALSENEPKVSTAVDLIEESRTSIGGLRTQVEETTRALAELAKVNALFESVADQLSEATFKSSIQATAGVAPYAVLVGVIEQIGDLAKRSVQGTYELRRQLAECASSVAATTAAVGEADATLQKLLTLTQVSQAGAGLHAPIEVEVRPSAPAKVNAGAVAAFWAAVVPKAGGFKN
jgi:hypothetical protein